MLVANPLCWFCHGAYFYLLPGAYTTGTVNPNLSKTNEYFPKTLTLTFDAANPEAIMGKILMFENVKLLVEIYIKDILESLISIGHKIICK
jgi:hypothetical protein